MGICGPRLLCVQNSWVGILPVFVKEGLQKIRTVNKGNVSPLERANRSSSIYLSVMLMLIVSEHVPSREGS